MKNAIQSMNKQSGAVLIFALAIMLLTGIIASTVMRTGVLEVKMVSNSQFKEEAFQTTEAVINAITADANNFVVAGDVGYKVCPAVTVQSNCNSNAIAISSAITSAAPSSVSLDFYMVRKGPLTRTLPMRQSQDKADSASSYHIATFEVLAEYDGRDAGLGHHKVVQGVGVKIAASAQ
ncbi:PilX-like prepilin protein [Alteromonadaceae bacterium 2753L.S.0a.02]|nr:PilX-like prepilin protein [Alteromonadaceae bacterium 2753L.S.0a.02]